MPSPFDIAKHISEKTPLEFDMKEYIPWFTNKIFSNTIDTLFYADVMNKYHHLDADIQYKFYYTALSKQKRYGKWNKKLDIDSNIELLMKVYKINKTVANSYVKLISEEDMLKLHQQFNQGGKQ